MHITLFFFFWLIVDDDPGAAAAAAASAAAVVVVVFAVAAAALPLNSVSVAAVRYAVGNVFLDQGAWQILFVVQKCEKD